jgi:hypothetical protein
MATRPFSYNPTQATIAGTTNLGTICIGVSNLDYSSKPGGLTWWMGPEEANSYIVCKDVPAQNFPTPLGNIGNVQFWRSANTNADLINLVSIISGTTQTSISAAASWLSSNGYWTNYTNSVTFSRPFVQGSAPGATTETAWNTFRAALTGSYTQFVISNTLGFSLTVSHATSVQTLATALKNATSLGFTEIASVTINSVVWKVGTGCGTPSIGGVTTELSNIGFCDGGATIALRPMIGNQNWGGMGTGSTLNQASQTITLTFS